MLFDSHAHLTDSKYKKDRTDVIERSKKELEYVLNPGADLASSKKAVELAKKHDFIYAAVGVHPHEAKSMDEITLKLLKSLTKEDKVKAIGEIGLDYYYDNSPRDIQKKWFIKQIRLAKELGLPIIIHDRDAHQDTLEILKKEDNFDNGVVIHCFSGSKELARQYVELGAYISLAGPVTFKNARKAKEVAKSVPLDRLFIETDSPYLTPEPNRGKRNEPRFVEHVCNEIAIIKGISYDKVLKQTKKNAKEFFSIE
ncbi:MAG: TatD family hydrolase [Bacillota bacterium]